ncbi:hypothetical protein L4G92_03565 [Neisseria sp. ZJ106]|uniref:hypothetical protein n=1 Tax=Neisseria lisongii TaxID=2912188 RepID=UPI001F47FC5A|nr:hypothetical protein [Neisseria lisongii]MCF7521131.1 hypothetical protein [Neisseria lisongii]
MSPPSNPCCNGQTDKRKKSGRLKIEFSDGLILQRPIVQDKSSKKCYAWHFQSFI